MQALTLKKYRFRATGTMDLPRIVAASVPVPFVNTLLFYTTIPRPVRPTLAVSRVAGGRIGSGSFFGPRWQQLQFSVMPKNVH